MCPPGMVDMLQGVPRRGFGHGRQAEGVSSFFFGLGDTLDTDVSPGGTYPPAPAFRQGGRKLFSAPTCMGLETTTVPGQP